MKIFHCDHCQQLVFFENTQCVSCGHVLAFLPDLFEIGSLEVAGDHHYLHMTDTLETAACGVSLKPTRPDEPSLRTAPAAAGTPESRFDRLIDSWYPLTYMLNSQNRGMGLADAYPFVLSTPAVEKLRVVHEIIAAGDPERT
jgi:hypothetical protein